MAITSYKTILTEAVRGYNNIQEALRLKFSGSSSFSSFKEIEKNGSTITNVKTAAEMVTAIEGISRFTNTTINGTVSESINERLLTLSFSAKIGEGYYANNNSASGSYSIQLATDSQMRDLALRHVDLILDVNPAASDEEQVIIPR